MAVPSLRTVGLIRLGGTADGRNARLRVLCRAKPGLTPRFRQYLDIWRPGRVLGEAVERAIACYRRGTNIRLYERCLWLAHLCLAGNLGTAAYRDHQVIRLQFLAGS